MTTTLINPSTGAPLREVPSTSVEETDAAIERAQDAFTSWRAIAPGERARLLRSFAAVVDAHVEELARLEVENSGHTIGNARWEAGNVRDCLNYYSAAPERLFGRQIPVAGGVDVTFREPLGVVGVIVPWNFPMPIAGWGFAPALAAGNTVVLKPAEITPLTAIRIARARAARPACPRACSRCCPGRARSSASGSSPTRWCARSASPGSTEVGKQIMAGCADQVKRVTLELGGKSANVVFADADVAKAAATAPYAVFDNAGQDCCARSRILVERSAYDEFVGRLETAVRGMKVVDPAQDDSEMGPMVSARQRDSVQAYIDGATVAFQGDAPGGDGYWLPPTVVESTSTDEAGVARGGVRAGRGGDGLRRRGGGGRAGQRHRVRAVGLDLHPRPRPGPARLPRASRPATSA